MVFDIVSAHIALAEHGTPPSAVYDTPPDTFARRMVWVLLDRLRNASTGRPLMGLETD